MNKFRQNILDELDDAYRKYDDTPDHIIVSTERFKSLQNNNRIERMRPRHEVRLTTGRTGSCGYMGMVLWKSCALDDRGSDALLLSNEVFESIFNIYDEPKLF